MDQNGFNNNNFFEGPVFIDGDTDIDGNLTVTGTYPGGGGSGVQNPMIENLDAGDFTIFNVGEITGVEGVLKTSLIDVQNNDIYFVNEIKGRSDDNKLYITGNVEMTEDLNMTNKSITNVNTLTISSLTSPNPTINCNSKSLINLNAIQLSNGLYFSAAFPPEENYVLYVLGGNPAGPIIDYKKAVFNPVEENVNMDNKSITNNNNIETKGISSSTGAIAVTSVVNMFDDINMNYHDIFNVERLTASHASVTLNLDMIPMTEGKAGQILARNPSYTPGNFSTHKLVWTNPASGTVTNPMTVSLEAGTFSIYNANIVECKSINILAGGGGIGSNSGGFAVPIAWGLAVKQSTAPFYQTFNTDYITPATNLGITIDSKAPDGITDSKITLSAPNIIFNNSTNLAPSLVTITGNLQITNSSGYIHGNNLIVRGRDASAVPTPITIEGTTTSINSSTLNITSSTVNNFLGAVNTNFSGTVRTNTIDANSGGTISVLQNLTLATGRQLRTDLVFTDGIRSYTTDLILTGLLPDNKTQTNIILASPQITLNNQFGPLTQETQVNIAGNIIFNNPVTQPFINGANLTIRGRTTGGVPTVLALEGSTISLIATTAININANAINIIKNVNLLSNRGSDINPSMVLYRTVGAPSTAFNITNGATFVNVTNGQTSKGTKSIPANSLVANDLYKFNVVGLMTSEAKIDMTFSIYSGANRLCTFTFTGDGLTNQGFEFTTTLCVTPVSLGVVSLSTGIGKFEKDGKQISYATPVNNINLTVASINTFDVYIKPVSTMAVGSVTIYSFTLENI
jgi:hypothetical protein